MADVEHVAPKSDVDGRRSLDVDGVRGGARYAVPKTDVRGRGMRRGGRQLAGQLP